MKYQVSVVPTQSLSFPRVKDHAPFKNYVIIKMFCYSRDVRKWPFKKTSAEKKHCLINVKIMSKLLFFFSLLLATVELTLKWLFSICYVIVLIKHFNKKTLAQVMVKAAGL